jgi:hypothetical protein
MANKQYYGCIRLTRHNPGWSDPINDIHLLRTHRTFKCVLEDYDLRPILKGIKDGLIEFTRADLEGTADADDGARLPVYCGAHMCAAHLIREGVLADYLAEVDYQSDLEWQPPVPAELPDRPAVVGNSNVQIQCDAEVDMKKPLAIQVGVDIVEPQRVKQEQPAVDADGNPVLDEEGNQVMEEVEVEQHREVTVVIEAAEGTVSPASVTFSSDPAADNYYGNGAVEVQFTAPEVTADKQVAINFSGDGVNAKSQKVKVKFVQADDPYITINGQKAELLLNRGQVSLEDAEIAVVAGDCTDISLANITMQLVNKAETNDGYAGTDGAINVADKTTISGICQPKSGDECVAAEIKITGSCGCGGHQINQTIQLKVPAMKGFVGPIHYQYMVFKPDQPPKFNEGHEHYLDDKLTMDIQPREEYDISDIGKTVTYVLIVPAGSPRVLQCIDPGNNFINKVTCLPFVVAGVDYTAQAVPFPAGGAHHARID